MEQEKGRIIEATTEHIYELAAFAAASFIHTFGHMYTPENLALFLDKSRSEIYYAKAIAAPDHKVCIICDDTKSGTPIIAYCKVGTNSLPNSPADALELAQLYVAKSHHGQGLGQTLLRQSVAYARAHKFEDMVLGVYYENTGAQRLYESYGFFKTGEYDFPVGTHIDREYIYLKSLK